MRKKEEEIRKRNREKKLEERRNRERREKNQGIREGRKNFFPPFQSTKRPMVMFVRNGFTMKMTRRIKFRRHKKERIRRKGRE